MKKIESKKIEYGVMCFDDISRLRYLLARPTAESINKKL